MASLYAPRRYWICSWGSVRVSDRPAKCSVSASNGRRPHRAPNSSQHSHLRLQLQSRQLPLGRHSLQGGQSVLKLALAVQAVGLQWGGSKKIRCLPGCAGGVAVAMRSARAARKAQTVAVGSSMCNLCCSTQAS